jgi:hypothetical protein
LTFTISRIFAVGPQAVPSANNADFWNDREKPTKVATPTRIDAREYLKPIMRELEVEYLLPFFLPFLLQNVNSPPLSPAGSFSPFAI